MPIATMHMDFKIDKSFVDRVDLLRGRVYSYSLQAMQNGMEEVADLTRKLHNQLSSNSHDTVVMSWLMPGKYGGGEYSIGSKPTGTAFGWETTGLSARSIQGYAVFKGAPADLPAIRDSFGRTHTTDARRVAPIPTSIANAQKIVGVLTMTTSYAPEESQSPDTTEMEKYGRIGLQSFEQRGAFDNHIVPHTPLTVLGLEVYQKQLADYISGYLGRTLRAK